MIKTIFFDIGNTLVNLYPVDKKILFKYFYKNILNDEITYSDYEFEKAAIESEIFYQKNCKEKTYNTRSFWLDYYQVGFKSIGVSSDKSLNLSEKLCNCSSKIHQSLTVIDGAKHLLESLKKNEIKIGALSNWSKELSNDLENLGIGKYFDLVISSEKLGCEKPDKRIFEEAISESKCESNEVMMVGDLYYIDIAPALSIGMDAVLYDSVGCLDDLFNCKKINKPKQLLNYL